MLEAEFLVFRRGVGKVKVRASVQGQTAVEGIIKFAMMESNGEEKS
jgi:3-hydroxyacyl-[acyl-carrier-protein] dehydratase